MKTYNKVGLKIIDELKVISGEKNVITDSEKLENYSHDELLDQRYMKTPEVVVLPETPEEISKIVKMAVRENIPVIPRGAGTALTSASIACLGGIVVSLEKMNKILEIDAGNMFMVTEPGVRTGDVQEAAREKGFLYAGDPCSGESSFIGGNVATNAGGNKAVKYGTTRKQVYGVEIVTAKGEIVTLGGKCMKDSTGYSLVNLIIGSEGTLGIITKIYLKLMPLPKESLDLLIVFPDLAAAIGVVPKIMMAGISLTCIEFMDNEVVRNCEKFIRESLPHSDRGNYIIIKLEGASMDALEEESLKIDEICSANGAIETLVADSGKIWKARKAFAEADRASSLVFSAEDIVVPLAKIPEAVKEITMMAKRYGMTVHCAGHAGDGNIHAHILKETMPDNEWNEKLHSLQDELYKLIYSLGGKLSGEHGIGYKRVALMEKFANPVELEMMKAIKKALDPNLILNPGKIFVIDQ
ncbi:MAG TPA: FAD-binding oxidoreductase [Candidatus Wallbacteria bacterium]|nr:FAD-binding oxidoreductase [Candidatus Wallbacteria bacterium]